MLTRVNLDDTQYEGSLSRLTRYGTMLTSHSTPKRARGKHKANRKDTRQHDVRWSDCIARIDGKVYTFKPARTSNAHPSQRKPNRRHSDIVRDAILSAADATRSAPVHTSTVESSFDKKHAQSY